MAGRKKQPISPNLAKFVAATATSDIAKCLPDRLADEDDLEFAWFQCYCYMGLGRTLHGLAKEVLIPLEVIKPISVAAYTQKLKRASLKNEWIKRVKVYDARRTIAATDSLIYTQQAIDTQWLDKGEKTRRVIQQSIDIALRIQACSLKILETIEPKIDELKNKSIGSSGGVLIELKQAVGVVSEVATITKAIQDILRNCWEGKEYTEAIQQLQQEILLIEQQDHDSATT